MSKSNKLGKIGWALLFAAVLAVGAFLPAVLAGSRTVYAAGATPTLITVTYYDGPLTRGFAWQTDLGVMSGEVQIVEKTAGVTKENVNWSTAIVVPATPLQVAYAPNRNSNNYTENYLTWKANYDFGAVAGNGKTYFYRLGSEGNWSATGEQTIDDGSNGVSIVHVTDPQGRDDGVFDLWVSTLNAAKKTLPDFQNVMFNGDIVQEAKVNAQWALALNKPQAFLMDTVFMPSAGNHDWQAAAYSKPTCLNARFTIKMAEEDPTVISYFYYSYDIGDVHVTVLNTNVPEWDSGVIRPEQVTWLKEDLTLANANPNIKWKIVMQHASLVGVGRYSSETTAATTYTRNLRKDLMPVYAQYKVDLVMQGHEHIYVRSKPVAWDATPAKWETPTDTAATGYQTNEYDFFGEGNRKFMENPNGTMYVTMAPAGGSRRQAIKANPDVDGILGTHPDTGAQTVLQPSPATNADDGQYGMFGALRIQDGVLLYETYSVEGGDIKLIDYFGVAKEIPQYEDIKAAALTVTAPATDKKPSESITGGTGFTAKLTWNDNPEKFAPSTAYTATITLERKSGYTFNGFTDTASIAGFNVNGIAPTFVSGTSTKLVFTVTFPKTKDEADGSGGCACGSIGFTSGGFWISTGGLMIIIAAMALFMRRKGIQVRN